MFSLFFFPHLPFSLKFIPGNNGKQGRLYGLKIKLNLRSVELSNAGGMFEIYVFYGIFSGHQDIKSARVSEFFMVSQHKRCGVCMPLLARRFLHFIIRNLLCPWKNILFFVILGSSVMHRPKIEPKNCSCVLLNVKLSAAVDTSIL